MSDDTSPQLGSYDVDRAALSAPGEPLDRLLASLGVTGSTPDADAPETGWRVLSPHVEGGPILVGAPARGDASTWHVGHVTVPDDEPARFAPYPDVLPVRPSVAERRAGLVLRWPQITRDLLDLDALAVDIVNDGSERWLPQGDAFFAVAALRPVGAAARSSFYAFVAGGSPAVALEPGEYARVVARIDPSAWRVLSPGPHELTAFVPTLRMTTPEPLLVDLGEEAITAHRPQPEPVIDADRQRVLAVDRLRHLRIVIKGRDAFPALIEAVRDARDDEQALARIRDLLDCGDPEAQAVYNMQLRRARIGYQDLLAVEVERLQRELDGGAP